ncbi:hypothetical protein Ciccas_011073 [Cichlidogyrus casuarinus]|uniref:Uncharacterized protein n=1 Tax=Cichlidogyrus casuarinus TaxID=1844966 RepID=A0ABD2PTF3_9PLAT
MICLRGIIVPTMSDPNRSQATDEVGNVVINGYDPNQAMSNNGKRLMRFADWRMPFLATCSLRVTNSWSMAPLELARRCMSLNSKQVCYHKFFPPSFSP